MKIASTAWTNLALKSKLAITSIGIIYWYQARFVLSSRPTFLLGNDTIIKAVIKRAKALLGSDKNKRQPQALVIPRAQHTISRNDISDNALKVLYRLNKAGFEAYLVGGCIRDLLLDDKPKDFDITTNATPEQIKGLFKNCRLIGRRFRLAHILFGREIIEVATFRGHHGEQNCDKTSKQSETGQLLRDNVYGTIEEDAQRRDFTVNALYYSIADYSIYDFANGVDAINRRQIELIGDPETRYREDPVRMLRAIRFATKLDMEIEPATEAPIKKLANLLAEIPAARLFDEVIKLLLTETGRATFDQLRHYGLFQQLFPILNHAVGDDNSPEVRLIQQVLESTQARLASGKRVAPAYLYAAILWYPVKNYAEKLLSDNKMPMQDAYNLAANEVLARQKRRVMIPNHFAGVMRDIWLLQLRFYRRQGKQPIKTLSHPKFRAAYDFVLARGAIEGGDLVEIGQWWTEYQKHESPQPQHAKPAPSGKSPRKKRPYRKRKKPTNDS